MGLRCAVARLRGCAVSRGVAADPPTEQKIYNRTKAVWGYAARLRGCAGSRGGAADPPTEQKQTNRTKNTVDPTVRFSAMGLCCAVARLRGEPWRGGAADPPTEQKQLTEQKHSGATLRGCAVARLRGEPGRGRRPPNRTKKLTQQKHCGPQCKVFSHGATLRGCAVAWLRNCAVSRGGAADPPTEQKQKLSYYVGVQPYPPYLQYPPIPANTRQHPPIPPNTLPIYWGTPIDG
jgi:putative component of membrane protein insertase Oxa1/YidC/SpoIIIJ protein YidD